MKVKSTKDLLSEIESLESRLSDSEQMIEAIRLGEVDAFAFNKNNKSEVFTLKSGDYAYRVLIENFNEGALNLSEDGLIVYTNSCFYDLLGLSYERIIGHSVFDFIHPSSKESFKGLFKRGLAGQVKGEVNLIAGKKIVPVYASLTSLYPNLPTVGMIVTDLTEKKKQEQLLQQQNEELEEKNIELEKMNKELETFSFVSSHDLQEPLRKIRSFANILLEEEQGNLSDAGKNYLQRMDETVKRMHVLIEDLLSYSRIKSAQVKFERTDLNKVFQEVLTDFEGTIKEKKAIISASGLCEMNVIPFQFRQLLQNLLGNALKFSYPGRAPYIIIKGKITAGNKLNNTNLLPETNYYHLSFTDNGIGFDPQYKDRIFEVFQRLWEYGEYKGTGIGLAICKKIVENHKGFITATGELNKGARFDIYIPVLLASGGNLPDRQAPDATISM